MMQYERDVNVASREYERFYNEIIWPIARPISTILVVYIWFYLLIIFGIINYKETFFFEVQNIDFV